MSSELPDKDKMDLAQRFPARKTDPRTLERLAAGARADWAAGEGRPVSRMLPWLSALSAAAVVAAALVYGLVLTRAKVNVEPSVREVPGETARSVGGENEKPTQAGEEDPKPAPQPKPAPKPKDDDGELRPTPGEVLPLEFETSGLAKDPSARIRSGYSAVEDAGAAASDALLGVRKYRIDADEVTRLGGSKETLEAVTKGLHWLALHQEPDGHWDCIKYDGKQADVAVTGLALLAFLASGHSETEGKYQDSVRRGIAWLKSVQADNGCIFKNGETHSIGYHHGIAGLALVEAAGLSKDPSTRAAAQRAVDYSIREHQNHKKGGWRYAPQSATSDICVSAWFIQQVVRARQVGLKIEARSLDGAVKFLDSVQGIQDGTVHLYGYTDSTSISYRRTAMGIYARQILGWDRHELQPGVDWFISKGGLPEWGAQGEKVDLYYWYYGSLVAFAQKGRAWQAWNKAMKRTLVDNQRKGGDEHGSWDPLGDYSGYWGRVGETALAALCLEVYYRYGTGYADPAPPRAPTKDEVALADKLIARMGSEEFQEREDALAELLKLGPPIHGHLEKRLKEIKAQERPDQEVVTRLTRAVQLVVP